MDPAPQTEDDGPDEETGADTAGGERPVTVSEAGDAEAEHEASRQLGHGTHARPPSASRVIAHVNGTVRLSAPRGEMASDALPEYEAKFLALFDLINQTVVQQEK